ncbi:MAG: heavy metal translocating P-type ATPase [Vulcanimicrobiaceae bacterium]
MNAVTEPSPASSYWAEEPASTPGHARFRAKIGGLHCSLCTGTIEQALGREPGVRRVAVSLTHEQALVDYDPSQIRPERLLQTLRDIGYTIWDPRKLRPFEDEERDLVREGRRLLAAVVLGLASISLVANPTGLWLFLLPAFCTSSMAGIAYLILRPRGLALAVASAGVLAWLAIALVAFKHYDAGSQTIPWIVAALAVTLVFGLAPHVLVMAYQSSRRGILNQHVMLEIGAFAGIAGGTIGLVLQPPGYPTVVFFGVSVLVVTYHLFSEWLSLVVKTRSSQAVKGLLDLQPDTARLVVAGAEREVGIADVKIGDVVRVRPGERIPVDGTVVSGRSTVDQAFVTGEPMPIERAGGDSVIGGSVNGAGTLLVAATAVGEESFLQQIVRHVEDARALKPGILHLVDRVLRIYTPIVLSVAALALVGWLVGSYVVTGHADVQRAVFASLSVLVMGYPCAVGISAPLSIVRGAGEAADRGILMRTGEAFQEFRRVTHVVLDKTGTLTFGKFTVRDVFALDDRARMLRLAAAAESSSEHPLGRAIVTYALEQGIVPPSVDDFEALPGRGIRVVLSGQTVFVGKPAFLIENGVSLEALHARIVELENRGQTVVAVAADGRALGTIALGDEIRSDASAAVAAMRKAKIVPFLVTGDNARAAERVGRMVGIEQIRANVLPAEKAELVRTLQAGGARVAMVGDGVNDAPALMQANVGIAMGAGTDIAIESADIIMISNRLESIVEARAISRQSYRKTEQNVVLAFLFNGIGIPLAATGLVNPVWAMVAMALSITSIFVNSLWGRPSLFFGAIASVGREVKSPAPAVARAA